MDTENGILNLGTMSDYWIKSSYTGGNKVLVETPRTLISIVFRLMGMPFTGIVAVER